MYVRGACIAGDNGKFVSLVLETNGAAEEPRLPVGTTCTSNTAVWEDSASKIATRMGR